MEIKVVHPNETWNVVQINVSEYRRVIKNGQSRELANKR
jgi:hypothetical protein